MKFLLILALAFSFISISHGQGGVHLQAGLVGAKNEFNAVTPKGDVHGGYKIGFDIRLGDGGLYFLPGFYYQKIGFIAQPNLMFFKNDPNFRILKARFGFGFSLLRLNRNSKIRGKIQGSLSFLNDYPEDMPPLQSNNYNEGYAGIDLGLGVDLNSFSIDLEYEKGIVNAVNQIEDSIFNIWSLSLGFFF